MLRPAHEERDIDRLGVGNHLVVTSMTRHHFAMIGCEYHDRVVREAGIVEEFHQPAEIVVNVAQHGVIATWIHGRRVAPPFHIRTPIERFGSSLEAFRRRLLGTPWRMRRGRARHPEQQVVWGGWWGAGSG